MAVKMVSATRTAKAAVQALSSPSRQRSSADGYSKSGTAMHTCARLGSGTGRKSRSGLVSNFESGGRFGRGHKEVESEVRG
eukprot:5247102-Pleurochrysis_carterae.AAC.1